MTQGPCVNVYHDGTNIVNVFLLCQGEEVLHYCGSSITALEVIQLVIGAYFVLNLHYPLNYQNILLFLESELLKCNHSSNIRRSITLIKFMKEYAS